MPREDIEDQLQMHYAASNVVALVYLFGSAAFGKQGPLSDIDVAVLARPVEERLSVEWQSRGAHELSTVLQTDRIDLVSLNDAPVELSYHVIAQGALVYCASMEAKVAYEAHVLGRYGDYLPVLWSQRQEILHPVAHDHRVQRYRTALRRTKRTLGALGTAACEESGSV